MTQKPKLFALPVSVVSYLFTLSVGIARAYSPNQNPSPIPAPAAPINNLTDTSLFVCGVLNWLFYFLIVLSVIFVLLSAHKYLTTGGEPEAVKTANKMLLYAAIAVAVGILAKAVPLIVATFFGVTSMTEACAP